MLFNSINFLFFFIIVTTLYYILNHKYRWYLLLGASCYFYMAFVPIYILILLGTIIIDYFAGILIYRSLERKRKLYLYFSLIANIGVLAVFKYLNFLLGGIADMLNLVNISNNIPSLNWILPIGLSFHTFQAMSYTIEIYRGNQKPERNFCIYALYVMYYPQLVAGPIERPQNLLHQFHRKFEFNTELFIEGLQQMAWGLFKKLVVADRLALYVNAVYGNVNSEGGITLLIASIFFSIQIYCDFSGYSEIAIGASKIMGIKLMTNFRHPFLSSSVSEFWKRWHISLSTWFKDYLYIPLGGNRRSNQRKLINIMIVFLVSGLWHGANYTFIIWGGLNGFYLVMEYFSNSLKIKNTLFNKFPTISKLFCILFTFCLTVFAFIFFRSNSIEQAFTIISKIFHFNGIVFIPRKLTMVYSVFIILVLLSIEIKHEYFNNRFSIFNNKNWFVKSLAYSALVLIILVFGVYDGGQFIYFQF